MSHNYSYRRVPPPAEKTPPAPSSQRSTSSSSSSRRLSFPAGAPGASPSGTQESDVALGLLRSYGLEPNDLSRLAELPEDLLNVESLPRLLKQLKEHREVANPYSSSSVAPSPSAGHPGPSRQPATPSTPSTDQWEHIRNQPVQYPLGHILSAANTRPPEQVSDWQGLRGNPKHGRSYTHPSGAEKPPAPSPSLSSCYVVDYGHKERPTDQGKKGRGDNSQSQGYMRDSFSKRPERGHSRTPPPRYSQADSANYASGPRSRAERADGDVSYGGAGGPWPAPKAPSLKEAVDFHGSSPGVYPYSCSLCDITVLSDKFWLQHINGPHHADQQLALLQRYPAWDCRMEKKTGCGVCECGKTKNEGRLTLQPPTNPRKPSGLHLKVVTNKKKPSGNSKVVCAKFEAQSLTEAYLRTLTEPFGKIVKVIMFPSLAFVEMGSSDQAKDLEKYYKSNPASGGGKGITFHISSTFSFLQSSRVVSFSPTPKGPHGFSELINVVKRFGPPLYTLSLPSTAFIEMKIDADAQKLVDYYSTHTLMLNSDTIKVAFSGEHNTLMRVPSAKKYEENENEKEVGAGTKRARSSSPQRGRSRGDSRTCSKKNSRAEEEDKEKRKRSRSHRSSSRKRHRGSPRSSSASGRAKDEEAVADGTKSIEPEPKAEVSAAVGPHPEPSETVATQDEAKLSDEESDIEGMEVIGEDGESLASEDIDALGDDDDDSEHGEEKGDQEEHSTEDFLENCITLDEINDDEDECSGEDKQEEEESKVICFRNLPSCCYTDSEFVNIVKDYGKALQYFLIRTRQEGFIEMSSWSEAKAATSELDRKKNSFKGSTFTVTLLHKYPGLTKGWKVHSESKPDKERREEPSGSRSPPEEELSGRANSEPGEEAEPPGREEAEPPGREEAEPPGREEAEPPGREEAEQTGGEEAEPPGGEEAEQTGGEEAEQTGGEEAEQTGGEEAEQTGGEEAEQTGGEEAEQTGGEEAEQTGGEEAEPPGREEAEQTGREEAEQTGREEAEAPGREEAEAPGREEAEPPGREEVEQTGREEAEPPGREEAEPPGREEVEQTGREEAEPPGREEVEQTGRGAVEQSARSSQSGPDESSSSGKCPSEKEVDNRHIVEKTPGQEVAGSEEMESKPGSKDHELSEETTGKTTTSATDEQTEHGNQTGGSCLEGATNQPPEDPEMVVQPQPGPVGGSVEQRTPTKPVGAEFVGPVVGYFCKLCEVIYVDENQAKTEHCSTLGHYLKYQERTGNDPWAS